MTTLDKLKKKKRGVPPEALDPSAVFLVPSHCRKSKDSQEKALFLGSDSFGAGWDLVPSDNMLEFFAGLVQAL